MFPAIVSALIIFGGVSLLFARQMSEGDEPITETAWFASGGILLGCSLFAICLPFGGLALAVPVTTLITYLAAGGRSLFELAFYAICLTIGCIILFGYLLWLPLPLGPSGGVF